MPKSTIPILNKLVDAQEMHRQHPITFIVPSAHNLATIMPGDYVKICRENERFWCKVIGGVGKFLVGEVDVPLVNEGNADINKSGTRVRFEHRHVYEIMRPPVR
jgi:hypothetical protein